MPNNANGPLLPQAAHVHFTGIKGVGMTASALCIQDLGHTVSGSDVAEDFVTAEVLTQRQIVPKIGFAPDHVPAETQLLVYTGAHQGIHNPEVVAALGRGIRVISHAEAVGELMAGKTGISVCGVGGKTSTTAMITNILEYAGLQPSFLIGVGKVLNLQVPGRMTAGRYFVAEADEYAVSPGTDNSPRFSYQTPHTIICTNISHDHPDIYATIEDTKKAFLDFFNRIPMDGLLVLNGNSGPLHQLNITNRRVIWYGLSAGNNDWWIQESYNGESKQMVRVVGKSGESYQFTLLVPGLFNAANALAAFIVAKEYGVDPQKIIQALQLFRGSMRRFEKIGEYNGAQLYDDYAHHPSQLFVTLQAARQWLPLYKIVAVFQPHTYSRTKVFLDQFAKAFTFADRVIITDIYASAREPADPTITGEQLAAAVKKHHANATYVPKNQLVSVLKESLSAQDALFTLGAGDIYQLHDQLKS